MKVAIIAAIAGQLSGCAFQISGGYGYQFDPWGSLPVCNAADLGELSGGEMGEGVRASGGRLEGSGIAEDPTGAL